MGSRWLVAGLAWLAVPAVAAAGPHSEVASAFDEGDHVDLHVWLDHEISWRRAAIEREVVGLPGTDDDDPLPLVRDLVYEQTRHTLVPRAELGFFTDLSLTLALPIVVTDRRRLELDRRDSPVARDRSPTLLDGLLPETGYDARDPTGAGFTTGPAVFRGVDRRGLDQLHVGLVWAPMNQARDRTQPTWKLGAETRIAVGRVAAFDRDAPSSERGVGRGLHELRLWTSFAKRNRWFEPSFETWWQAAVGETKQSPFNPPSPGFGASATGPMQEAGGRVGVRAIVWRRPADDLRVELFASGALEARFEGRDYSEMWEVFAYAGESRTGGPLVLDADPTRDGVQRTDHPGISNSASYFDLIGTLGVEASLGDLLHVALRARYADRQDHLISHADPGRDRPTCTGDGSACEDDGDVQVDPGSVEVNPLYAPLIDAVGHRYRVTDGRIIALGFEARILF